ncbi:MAG TPA: DUF6282 family protein [Acidobacteriota bacterium]|jgi:hypothetical protein|nr:DUF6282 family protein [Acidobacteriota bacterium]
MNIYKNLLTLALIFSLLLIALHDTPAQSNRDLLGVIDIHAHADPDSMARSIDVIDLARKAQAEGMRGLVIKNHFTPTAGYAFLARKLVAGIELFGGVVLNRSVGGINPVAVESMSTVKGGYGRVVWMPTFDAENEVRFFKANRPFVCVAEQGRLRPEVKEVLRIIAQKNLVLATGHSSPQEALLLVRAARDAGVRHMVITHAMLDPVDMSIERQKEAAAAGAFIEHVFQGTLPPLPTVSSMPSRKKVTIQQYASAIKAVGAEHCILSSDLGQAGNPLHTEGLRSFILQLKAEGITDREIDLMARKNPARLLGLQ